MKALKIFLTVSFIAALAAGANADKRGISEGKWCAGEFSEPAYISRWGYGATDQASINTVTSDPARLKAGKSSIKLDTTSGFDTWVYFPNTKDMDLDVSACTAFRFMLTSVNKNGWGSDPWVIFRDMSGNAAQFDGIRNRLSDALKGWVEFSVPVGPGAETRAAEGFWKSKIDPGFDWKHIASFEIHSDTGGYGFQMWYDGVEFVGERPAKWWLSSVDKPDLTVTWAEQIPGYKRYFPTYDNGYPELKRGEAEEKHWPAEGEKIKYIVHIRNVGFARSRPTDFACAVDGKPVSTAKVPALAPRQETTITVPWTWKNGTHEVVGRVDTKAGMDEISKKNNVLRFNTNAYTLYAFCETGMTKQVDAVNNYYGSFSFEDWLRGATVDSMNRLFKHSKYDFAPNGARISVRIGKVFVVDQINDQAKNVPEMPTFDGGWDYGSKGAMEYCNLANSYMWALDHELTHQMGIIDDYQFDLPKENNKINGKAFSQPDGGMMGGGHIAPNAAPAYADIDVAGLNATAGFRRGYFGEYLYNTPDRNTLVLTAGGKPLSDAQVSIYQRNDSNGQISEDAIQTGQTDSHGRFSLANRPVKKQFTTATGCTLKPNPFGHINVVGGNGLLLVRAKSGEAWYYGFIDIGHFVTEYARGHRASAQYPMELAAE